MNFSTRFNPPKSPSLDFKDSPSLARAEFEPECNINNILAKFKVTGVLVDPAVRNLRQPMFLDCTSVPDLETYHANLNACKESFESLPKEVQEAFGFDARIAMQWLSNASDRQVVQLFHNLSPSSPNLSSSKGGLGGASTPQSSPDSTAAASDSPSPAAAHISNDSPATE